MNIKKVVDLVNESNKNGEKKYVLAEKIGVDRTYLSNFEAKCSTMEVKTLEKFAEYFKKPIGYFFDEPDLKDLEFKIYQLEQENNVLKNQHIGDNNQRNENGSNTISNTGNIEGNQNNNHYIGYTKEEMVSVLNERYKIIKNKEKQVDTLLESQRALIDENKHLINILERFSDKLLTN